MAKLKQNAYRDKFTTKTWMCGKSRRNLFSNNFATKVLTNFGQS